MFNKNLIQLTGNVTDTPETRTAGGTTVTRARLIHNETYRKDDGTTTERIVAVDLDVWGKRGEAFAKHINPKVPVYVEGRLQLDQWEHEGTPRSRLLVRVLDWQFIGAPVANGSDGTNDKVEAKPSPNAKGRKSRKAATTATATA